MSSLRKVTILLLLFIAANALAAGYLLIKDPSGQLLKLPLSKLEHSPFLNFFIPGLVLFTVNGILNVIAAAYAYFKWKGYPQFVLCQSVLLVGWIAVQIAMLREVNWLHVIIGGIGITLFFLGNKLRAA